MLFRAISSGDTLVQGLDRGAASFVTRQAPQLVSTADVELLPILSDIAAAAAENGDAEVARSAATAIASIPLASA